MIRFAEALDPMFGRQASEETWTELTEAIVEDFIRSKTIEIKNNMNKTVDLVTIDDNSECDDGDDSDFDPRKFAMKKMKVEMPFSNNCDKNSSIEFDMESKISNTREFITNRVLNEIESFRFDLKSFTLSKDGLKTYNVLQYYKKHMVPSFPYISHFSKKIFCIQATSAASERVFSQMGLLVSDKRHSLHSDTIITILFLKLNIRIVKSFLYNLTSSNL